jgi:hypothetical protein
VFGVCLGCHTFALKKLAVMVNGTTYAKKIEVEHKKRKHSYRYKKNKLPFFNILSHK